MLLLVGTSMLIQRLLMGFFWSNLFEMGRNVRTGYFDFYLAQPGQPALHGLDPQARSRRPGQHRGGRAVVVYYAAHRLGLHPGVSGVLLYLALVACGLVIHYSLFLLTTSTTFWIIKTEGIEGSYFTVVDFSRLPREAFRGVANVLLVYLLPAVVVSNVPASTLIHGFQPVYALWLGAASAGVVRPGGVRLQPGPEALCQRILVTRLHPNARNRNPGDQSGRPGCISSC